MKVLRHPTFKKVTVSVADKDKASWLAQGWQLVEEKISAPIKGTDEVAAVPRPPRKVARKGRAQTKKEG